MTTSDDKEPLLDDDNLARKDEGEIIKVSEEAVEQDERFNPPPPAPWKRVALLVFICALFYVAFNMRASLLHGKKPPVVHATRYSKEFKYRPAASPIITETLKDGRTRLRGAAPTTSASPKPTASKKRRSRRSGSSRAGGKAKRKKSPSAN